MRRCLAPSRNWRSEPIAQPVIWYRQFCGECHDVQLSRAARRPKTSDAGVQAGGDAVELHFGHDHRRQRRKAVHLMAGLKHPVTPDGRYFVVRGRLWRLANPSLSSATRSALVSELMTARSAVRSAKLGGDQAAEAAAHHVVDVAKRKLGERGPVWWVDGSPDLNRHLVKNTPYASWHSALRTSGRRVRRVQPVDVDNGRMP